ncbi:ATP/GTP-binding protein [Streptomyces sp. NBC_01171]|uniref:ATP/GTP-binding protein n=1 Tax=Streptomyces sp. NBC_01171 TaxID=2903757 RepID=UPI0038648913|nr:ATP/GTP-binding protein [Streptomyces sp. NBC_01171]
MSGSDLRALFRSNDRELKAVDFFADRQGEWASVAESLVRHTERVRAPGFDVQDLEAPRRNVLVFYGVGGIGKSTLSRGVADRLADGISGREDWPPLHPSVGRVLPIRIDLSRETGADVESLMLALRLAVADLGHAMPAFDIAFQRYWQTVHPGEPLEEYLRHRTWFSRLPGSNVLPQQMQSVLSDAAQAVTLPGTAGALVGVGLRALVGALRDRRHRVRTLAGCRRLADLLEAEPNQDTLSYFAHLLAWDLEQLPEKHRVTPVVMLDTFEEAGHRGHRDLEKLLQRVVWLMPNALFVVTGRNRLQWADATLEGQLDWAGPEYWPQLVGGALEEPRQHTVGYLSAEDCEIYLCERLTIGGEPLLDDRARRFITRNSYGLPLYLDLAVMRFLDLYRRSGRAPDVHEFNLDFPALVARTFRDLAPETRRVLRSVSLLDSFSISLATTAAGLDHDAPAMDLAERPFVDADPAAPWPFRLHDLIRGTVREADSTSEDRWSEADWQRAALRAFQALGLESDRDRTRLVASLRQGLRLANDYRLDLGWLEDAAFRYVEDFIWEPLGTAGTDMSDLASITTPAHALSVTLTAVAGRQRRHRSLTAETLRRVLASGHLPETLRELPQYFLAECDRDLGNFQASLSGMQQVIDIGGRLAATAARGQAHLARRVGCFPQVRDAVATLGTEGRRDRVLGDLWWSQGSVALACASYAASRDEALSTGQSGEAALSQACLSFASAFQDRPRAAEQIARAKDLLGHASIRWAEIQVEIAVLVRDAGMATDLPERAEQVAVLAREAGLTSSVAYVHLAACFHAAVLDSPALLEAARDRLATSVRGEEFAYLMELTYLMRGDQRPSELPAAQWLDGVQQTQARWAALVADRRREAAANRGA